MLGAVADPQSGARMIGRWELEQALTNANSVGQPLAVFAPHNNDKRSRRDELKLKAYQALKEISPNPRFAMIFGEPRKDGPAVCVSLSRAEEVHFFVK